MLQRDDLEILIRTKFKKLSNCAKALDINTSTLSALMDNRTPESYYV